MNLTLLLPPQTTTTTLAKTEILANNDILLLLGDFLFQQMTHTSYDSVLQAPPSVLFSQQEITKNALIVGPNMYSTLLSISTAFTRPAQSCHDNKLALIFILFLPHPFCILQHKLLFKTINLITEFLVSTS